MYCFVSRTCKKKKKKAHSLARKAKQVGPDNLRGFSLLTILPPPSLSHRGSLIFQKGRDSLPLNLLPALFTFSPFLIFSKFYFVFALTYEVAIKNKVLGRVEKHYIVVFFCLFFFTSYSSAASRRPLDFFLAGWPVVDLSPRSIHFNHNGQSRGWGGSAGSGGGGGGGGVERCAN